MKHGENTLAGCDLGVLFLNKVHATTITKKNIQVGSAKVYASLAFSLFRVGAPSLQSPRSLVLCFSTSTPFFFMSFLLTSLHLSFGLPIFRCPPTSIFSLLHLRQSFSTHGLTISAPLVVSLMFATHGLTISAPLVVSLMFATPGLTISAPLVVSLMFATPGLTISAPLVVSLMFATHGLTISAPLVVSLMFATPGLTISAPLVVSLIVRWLNKKIVTRWIKAPNFAHVFFRCLSNILEGGARATTPWSG